MLVLFVLFALFGAIVQLSIAGSLTPVAEGGVMGVICVMGVIDMLLFRVIRRRTST